MPCCAFAAFVVSQIVLGFGAVKKFLLRSTDSVDEAPNNPATEWRLIGGAAAPAPRRFGIRALALAGSIEMALMAGAAYGYHHHMSHHDNLAGAASLTVCTRVR
jgi:hypothetical protein